MLSPHTAGADTFHSQDGDPKPNAHTAPVTSMNNKSDSAGMGVGMYAVVLVGAVLAFVGYQYLSTKNTTQIQI